MIVALSPEVPAELARLGVAAPDRFVVTPWASIWPLFSMTQTADRLFPAGRDGARRAPLRRVTVGDGELRAQLASSAEAPALSDRVVWAEFRRDMVDVYFAS